MSSKTNLLPEHRIHDSILGYEVYPDTFPDKILDIPKLRIAVSAAIVSIFMGVSSTPANAFMYNHHLLVSKKIKENMKIDPCENPMILDILPNLDGAGEKLCNPVFIHPKWSVNPKREA